MRRVFLAFAAAVFLALLVPASSEAAVIQCFDPSISSCKPIGLFTWDQPFDDLFTVFNQSDGPDAPTTGASFNDVVLTLDPGVFETVVNFGTLAAGDQTDTSGAGFFFFVLQADLGFTFMSEPFSLSLTGPTAVPIYAEVLAAPEPSALVLFGSGALIIRHVRRRRR